MKKILTITELSKYIGMNKKTLYRKVKDGSFPVEPIQGLKPRRWNKSDIDKFFPPHSSPLGDANE